MPTAASGNQIIAFLDGGAANEGQDVYFVFRVKVDDFEHDITFSIAEDLVPVLISNLVTYGGMARQARLLTNPYEEADHTYIDTYALRLTDVIPGRSLVHHALSLLTLQFDGGAGTKLNLYCAADLQGLRELATACRGAEQLLHANYEGPPRH